MDIILAILGGIVGGAVLFYLREWFKRVKWKGITRYGNEYKTNYDKNMEIFNDLLSGNMPPAIPSILINVSLNTANNLVNNGEEITLIEYGELLEGSYSSEISKIHFIARTRPSDWYSTGTIGERITEYLINQAEWKSERKEDLTIKRSIVLRGEDYNENKKHRDELIRIHNEYHIELYFCDKDRVKKDIVRRIKDMAIFEDVHGRQWVITGIDFTEDTIRKYIEAKEYGIEHPMISVKIEYNQRSIANNIGRLRKELKRIEEHQ